LIYALSGAVGPILSQNLGARQFDRVRECLRASLWFMVIAVGGAWFMLALLQGPLIRAFSLDGVAADMVHAFASWVCASFFFAGALVRCQRGLQQSGAPAVVYRLQLGACNLGHDSICLVGRALRPGAGAGRSGHRAGHFWNPGDGGCSASDTSVGCRPRGEQIKPHQAASPAKPSAL